MILIRSYPLQHKFCLKLQFSTWSERKKSRVPELEEQETTDQNK